MKKLAGIILITVMLLSYFSVANAAENKEINVCINGDIVGGNHIDEQIPKDFYKKTPPTNFQFRWSFFLYSVCLFQLIPMVYKLMPV